MRRSREIWAELVRQYERSGLSDEEYAGKRGISVSTFRWWMWRLRRDGDDRAALLPVRVISSTALPARRPEEDAAAIEVELGEVRLRFPSATPASVIAEVVGLLRARC